MPETPQAASPSPSLEQKFVTLQGWQRVGQVQLYVTALVVVGLFGNFAYRTYHDVVGGFTPERNQRAVESALPIVTPAATKVLKDAVSEVLPEVRKQAGERYESVRGKLGEKALARFSSLPDRAGDVLNDGLQRAFERAIARVGPDAEKAFPTLSTPEGRAQMAVYLHEVIDARNKDLAGKIEKVGVNEAARVHAVLEKFSDQVTADARSDEELQQNLIRTLLHLAEQELEQQGPAAPHIPQRSTASLDGN